MLLKTLNVIVEKVSQFKGCDKKDDWGLWMSEYKLFCKKCNDFKNNFIYANKFNSTKFCEVCGTALELKEYEEEFIEDKNDFIFQSISNAFMKLFNEWEK